MVSCVHVIDPDVRRRALVSHELHAQLVHVEIYESIVEFMEVGPQDGLILLADVPNGDGRAVRELVDQSHVRLPIIGYAEAPTPRSVVEAMLAGAHGYLEWPFERTELVTALTRMAEEGERKLKLERRASDAKAQVEALSRREKEVLLGLIAGLSNKDIGHTLSISARTVEIHRSHMMLKLKARSVADAVRIGLHAGLDEHWDAPRFREAA